MAEISINRSTYGRDVVGSEALLNNLTQKLNDAIAAVKGRDYDSLLTTV